MNTALEVAINENDTALMAECYRDLGVLYNNSLSEEGDKYLKKALELDSFFETKGKS